VVVGAAFPWDVAITAVSTIVAGLGAAVLTARGTRRAEVRQWRLEQQRQAAEVVLKEWSDLYLSLTQARRERRTARSRDGRWLGPVVEVGPWNAALERLALVADRHLVESARDLDREMWRLIRRVGELGDLAYEDWAAKAETAKEARRTFTNTARRTVGLTDPIVSPQGRPDDSDPIWDPAYWASERERLQSLVDRPLAAGDDPAPPAG
jgi:hypothetical protein